MRRICFILLLVLTLPTVSLGQTLAGSVKREVSRAVAQQQPDVERYMPAKYKWTGVGLLIGGAAEAVLLGAMQSTMCDPSSLDYSTSLCTGDHFKSWMWIESIALAGAGAAILAVGATKTEVRPVQRGVTVRYRIRF